MAKIGYALSGGGARGIAHLGMLQALDEAGVRPQELAGTSAGAIVGAFYSYGYSPREILKIIQEAKIGRRLRLAKSFDGLFSMKGTERLYTEFLPGVCLEDLPIPLTVSATDIDNGQTVYFSKGPLAPPLMASSSIPVFFAPYTLNGVRYVDGGVLNNMPVEPLINHCDLIVGMHTNPVIAYKGRLNPKSLLERTMLLTIGANVSQTRKGLCQVFLEPPGMGKFRAMDLGKIAEMFTISYDYTKLVLKDEEVRNRLLS